MLFSQLHAMKLMDLFEYKTALIMFRARTKLSPGNIQKHTKLGSIHLNVRITLMEKTCLHMKELLNLSHNSGNPLPSRSSSFCQTTASSGPTGPSSFNGMTSALISNVTSNVGGKWLR